jgi:arginase
MQQPLSKVEIIGYDSGWGSRDFGCEDGPAAIHTDRLMHKLRHLGFEPKCRGTLSLKFLGRHEELNTKEKTLPLVVEGAKRLSNHVKHALENQYLPIVIGGDHSSAIGTWSGVVSALEAQENFGLIWLDAHLDAHTEETSKSGKWGGWWHGQLLSTLLGYGLPELKNIGGTAPKLSPKHISIIGVHSFEPEEEAFVKEHGIKVYSLDDVRKRGFAAVYMEALQRATDGTQGFGMTIDLDCFDPQEAPGVGAIENDGLHAKEILPIIKSLARDPRFKALEIAEFNPHRDKEHKTRILVEKLIETVFAKSGD